MIKCTGRTTDGREMTIIGLSEMNLAKLREGKPIHVFGAELGPGQRDIVIFWGETEDAMTAELEQAFTVSHADQVPKQ